MVRRSVADDSYGRGPFARSIELREVETLPRAQLDRAVANRERPAVADKDRSDVSAAVALPPLTTRTVRCPRGSIFPARTAASGAAPDGSTKSDRDSRYSYDACSRS